MYTAWCMYFYQYNYLPTHHSYCLKTRTHEWIHFVTNVIQFILKYSSYDVIRWFWSGCWKAASRYLLSLWLISFTCIRGGIYGAYFVQYWWYIIYRNLAQAYQPLVSTYQLVDTWNSGLIWYRINTNLYLLLSISHICAFLKKIQTYVSVASYIA